MVSQSAYQAASRALGLGQLDHAQGLFRSIAAGASEYVDAVMSLAVIAYSQGRFPEAVVHFSKLVALHPEDAANHCNLGECLREAHRLDDALIQLMLGISLDPDQPDAFNSLGLIHHAQRRLEQAEEALRWAIHLKPDFPTAMINLGIVLQERRQSREAADWFRRALERDPDNAMGCSNLGQILVEIGGIEDLDEAELLCLKAIRLTPGRAQPVNNLGNVYRAMGRFEEALECYRKATSIAPQLAMPLNNMAQAMQGRARHAEAADYYLNALALEPNSPRIHANYASLFNEQERPEDALARYRHALVLDPNHAESHCGMGQVHMKSEDVVQAEACFRKAMELDPELTAPRLGLSNLYSELGEFERAGAEIDIVLDAHPRLVEVHYQRVMHHKGKVSDCDVEAMTALLNRKYLGEAGRSQLHFALGTVNDRRGDYEAAARHFRSANELQIAARLKRNEAYDPANFSAWTGRMIAGFSADLIERIKRGGHTSRSPIFVVGFPRSGTTLTEQILASHPAIHGAGELKFVLETFEALPATLGLSDADPFHALSSLDSAALVASAEAYLKKASKHAGGAAFVVDKMPDNVNNLGWIRLMVPNAKVIHCRRDLRDVALSCWQTCFGAIRWANDWREIAGRFADSLRTVEHWKTISNIEWLDFPYESVIEDTETYARRLIDYVGLDWAPNCLKFHETKRPVRTASLSQVREPIYKTSVAKWRNYEREMTPFIEEMARRGHVFT